MKSLITFLFLAVIFASNSFPQYSSKDRDLVKTTFTRNFNIKIETEYLHSTKAEDIIAGLLSIAESGDTAFIPEVEKLDFPKYSRYICFTLGEIGPSENASTYLLRMLKQNGTNNTVTEEILGAIGKTGNYSSYSILTKMYINGIDRNFPGISTAMLDFYLRHIGSREVSLNILYNELTKFRSDPERYFQAAFTISRIGVSRRKIHFISDELSTLINKGLFEGSPFMESATSCLLKTLSRASYFPYDPRLRSRLLHTGNFNLKIQALKAISFYDFTDLNEFIEYLRSLDSRNDNIAEVLAASLSNLKLSKSLSDFLNGFVQKALSNRKYSRQVKGELLLSYINLYNPDFKKIIRRYSKTVPKEFLYGACSKYKDNKHAITYLIKGYKKAKLRNKALILSVLSELRENYPTDKNINGIFEKAINSNTPSLISIAADGIDTLYINIYKNRLQKIILSNIKRNLNKPGFYESMISLADLAKRIDSVFNKTVIRELSKSKLFPVKMFAEHSLSEHSFPVTKDTLIFGSIWQNAFKYKSAVIKTNAGTFKIKFLPQFAPLTVGNFCTLANKKFFKNILFHRVVPGFVIQGGDPTGTGWGGPGYEIVSEFSPEKFLTGAVGMASAGKDTEGSQWFIMTGNYPHLNGRYTLFGRITAGQNVVDSIVQGNKIISISLF